MSTWALVGSPNSGKTTLYNWLTGSKSKTVNYPGSTVEYNFGPLRSALSDQFNGADLHFVDFARQLGVELDLPSRDGVTDESQRKKRQHGKESSFHVVVSVSVSAVFVEFSLLG